MRGSLVAWLLALGGAQQGRPPLVELQAAVDRNPGDPAAWLNLAHEFERGGREADAARAFRKAVATPEGREGLGRLLRYDDSTGAAAELAGAAELFEKAGRVVDADRCRRELIRTLPNSEPARAAFTRLLDRAPADQTTAVEVHDLFALCGRPGGHIERLTTLAKQVPDLAGPAVALAEAHAANGQADRAEIILTERVATRPDAAAYRALTRLWAATPARLPELVHIVRSKAAAAAAARKAGNEAAAEAAARHVRAVVGGLRAEPAAVAALLPQLRPFVRGEPEDGAFHIGHFTLNLAEAADLLGRAEASLRAWLPGAPRGQAHGLYDALLRSYALQGKFAEAERLCRRGPEVSPQTSLVLWQIHRTRSLMRLGREEEALEEADAAVKHAGPRTMLATRLLKMDVLDWFGRDDEADAEARRVLEEFPDAKSERETRLRISSLASRRGDFAAAERHLRRVLELAPADPLAHNNLGYLYAEFNRRPDEATRLCRFAVDQGRAPADDLDPGGDDPAYRDSLGWAYYRQGRLIAAREELERALALPGGRRDPVVWEHLGDVLAAGGKPAEARAAWTEALARFEPRRAARDDPRPAGLKRKLAAAP